MVSKNHLSENPTHAQCGGWNENYSHRLTGVDT